MIRLLTLQQTAEALGCSTRTVRRRIASRELACVRDGGLIRVASSALDSYIAKHTIPAAGDPAHKPRQRAVRSHYSDETHHPDGRIRRLYDDPPPAKP